MSTYDHCLVDSVVHGLVLFLTPLARGSFKKLKAELPCDLAIPLQEIYPKGMKQRDTVTPTFTAELHTRTKAWDWLWCSPLNEWNHKMCYIYSAEYYKAIKINESLSFLAKEMELDSIK